MRNNMNLLNEAINALKNRPIPSGPPAAVRQATIERLQQAAKQTPALDLNFDLAHEIKTIKLLNKVAVAAAAIILGLIGIAVFEYVTDHDTNNITVVPSTENDRDAGQNSPEANRENLQLAEELKQAEQLFSARDNAALLKMLPTAQFETKVQIAEYLAQIGDADAIEPLKEQSDTWKADPAANPFDAAVEAIQQRLGSD
jgi:hypothetical protein